MIDLLRNPWVRRVGMAVGLVLLVLAIAMVWRQRETLIEAREALTRASPAMIGLLAAAVALNVVLSGAVFWLLISRYGQVGLAQMIALTAAAALLNYLPLRAGLLGRITWHKAVNGIPVVDSMKTVLQALALSGVAAVYLAAALFACGAAGAPVWAAGALPVPVLMGACIWKPARLWCAAGALRLLDVSMWALRYHAAFVLIGAPIEPQVAIVLACVSIIATMVPFVSNGLGLREWAIGLAAPLLTVYHLELGLTAELVNRAAEIVVILVLGLTAVPVLLPAMRRAAPSP